MPSRAGGFCIYNDVALAIARARRRGPAGPVHRPRRPPRRRRRGDPRGRPGRADGLDPRERPLPVPGHGVRLGDRRGRGGRARSSTCRSSRGRATTTWLGRRRDDRARSWRPRSGPTSSSASTAATPTPRDPLAHLAVTTTSIGRRRRGWSTRSPTGRPGPLAATAMRPSRLGRRRQIAHQFAGGRWLATGGGGYGVYSVVPRAWAHVWLAAPPRTRPMRSPTAWRERWAGEAARYGVTDLPRRLDDDEVAGTWQEANEISRHTVAVVRESLVPRHSSGSRSTSAAWTPLERGRADEDRRRTPTSTSRPPGHAVDRRRRRVGSGRAPDVRAAADREPVTCLPRSRCCWRARST